MTAVAAYGIDLLDYWCLFTCWSRDV